MTPWIVLPTLAVYWLAALLLQVYGLNCYIMIVLFWRRRRERAREEQAILSRFAQTRGDDDLPVVTTQLPIFNECNVVERLMQAACAFDYPPGKHEIQVLDDSTDETVDIVRELAARMRAEGHDIHHLHRPHRTGYKAGALEDGLRVARGELVAVFDADFVPEPDFLRKTVPFLVDDPSLGFVQTRWGHRNRGFSPLTRVQAIGIDGHFVVEQSARSWNRLFFNFNGTGGIWRKEAIHRAGGWQADTLTEDLDLSYRTQLAGYSARFLVDVITPAELPTDVNAFKSQQHRWAKGSIQTAMKLLPVIWRRPDISRFKKFESTVHLTHYLVHPLMLIMTILILPLLMWTEFTFKTVWVAVPFALMFLAVFAPTSMYALAQVAANRDWRRAVWILPFLMSVGIGLAVNNTRAVIDAFLGRKSEFVRTPKLGTLAETPVRSTAGALPAGSYGGRAVAAGGLIRYHLPRKRLFVLEILVGVWAAAAFVQYILLHKFLVGPLLLIQAVGFIYVGVLSYLHDVRARRPV